MVLRACVQVTRYLAGFCVCVLSGLLFSVLVPAVCSCVCCCRVAGRCAGKQAPRPSSRCHCVTLAALLASLTLTTAYV
jgi:hypothetical protein